MQECRMQECKMQELKSLGVYELRSLEVHVTQRHHLTTSQQSAVGSPDESSVSRVTCHVSRTSQADKCKCTIAPLHKIGGIFV